STSSVATTQVGSRPTASRTRYARSSSRTPSAGTRLRGSPDDVFSRYATVRLRPLEQRSHDALQLAAEIATGRATLARVAHVERDQIARGSVVEELRRPDRADVDVHGDEALVQEVAGNPGRGDVVAGRPRIAPTRARVHRVERNLPFTVEQLDLREDRLALSQNGQPDLDSHGTTDVDCVRARAVLVDDSDATDFHQVVAGSRLDVRPLLLGGRAVAHLKVLRDYIGT